MRGFTGVLLQPAGLLLPEIRKIQISVRIQISAAAGFSAGWLRISATSQRLRNRADDKGCTLAAQCVSNYSRIMYHSRSCWPGHTCRRLLHPNGTLCGGP